MISQQLLAYIKQQLQQGVSKEVIVNNLISNDWQKSDIEKAFNLVNNSVASQHVSEDLPISSNKIPTKLSLLCQALRRF